MVGFIPCRGVEFGLDHFVLSLVDGAVVLYFYDSTVHLFALEFFLFFL
jgi:hypothetical protein